MMVYVAQTRSRWLTARLADRGWGECTCRGELPPRRHPWFFDNGAFRDFKAGRHFNDNLFRADMREIRNHGLRPRFVVVPDIVTSPESLGFSRSWLKEMRQLSDAPLYLAVQDGMSISARTVQGFDGIFVGGSLEWKLNTGQQWASLASKLSLPCHIGRVGSGKRVQWARRIGATSIDSALPLWSARNLAVFERAVNDRQLEMWGVGDCHG